MKNLPKTVLAVLAAAIVTSAFSTQDAHATPINGTIDFAGSVRFDSSALQNTTRVVIWRDVFGNAGFSNVAATSGDFSSIALGTQAAMATPWIFNPSTPTPGLWSVGGFTFNLLSATIITQTATFLNIMGTGIVSGNGFEQTPATWAFTVQNAGGNHDFFSFSANLATQGVPDGGSAVAMLGIGLGVIEFVRRRLRLRS
jgi:VPDSG-CTERM motif